ncbi:hypothetical protein [Rhodopseudomonas sp. BR0G17]|jgi:hypothetical protein|uniref:hypothetical protein n=1 Tax=Rhodopseudomonas sp. BR0G17 TaxID=2269368 RepID=UPI0013DED4F1|nr:hypothetical protein [Rhodopseudomonas sp. BR0G17]
MSSRQLEEMLERDHDAAVAAALGIPVNDRALLELDIDDVCSDDGVLYGHVVYFRPGSDHDVMAAIPGLDGADWIRIPPLAW